jgi:hypothetical protein
MEKERFEHELKKYCLFVEKKVGGVKTIWLFDRKIETIPLKEGLVKKKRRPRGPVSDLTRQRIGDAHRGRKYKKHLVRKISGELGEQDQEVA